MEDASPNTCEHREVELLSPWELIRKYACVACGGVLTCSCDAVLATRVLPHQALTGTDSYSAARVTVTHPLTPSVCDDCRSLPPKAFPRSEQRGATTKIHRYYWRELWTESHLRFLQWCDDEVSRLWTMPASRWS